MLLNDSWVNNEIKAAIRNFFEKNENKKTMYQNLEEMDTFLDTYTLPRLNQEEVKSLKRPITSSEIKPVIKAYQPKKKVQVQTNSEPNCTRGIKRSWYYFF